MARAFRLSSWHYRSARRKGSDGTYSPWTSSLCHIDFTGQLDSLLNLYTAAKKPRRQDAYSPGGKSGKRPERAAIVYSRLARAAYPDVPVILGGIEASLRRFVHYDFWDDDLRPSILEECAADLLIYGMGEKPLAELAFRLAKGKKITDCHDIPGICYLTEKIPPPDALELPGLQSLSGKKERICQGFSTSRSGTKPL